jgi:hypothetical protein
MADPQTAPRVEVQCQHCKRWFPSLFGFSSREVFETFQAISIDTECPKCGKTTPYHKEFMRAFFEDGGR